MELTGLCWTNEPALFANLSCNCMMMNNLPEWLEGDGLGGFASGTISSGERTRRYHALLLAATTPPTGRMVLVNGFDAWVETSTDQYLLTRQQYVGWHGSDQYLESFSHEPWPTWVYRLTDGVRIQQEVYVARASSSSSGEPCTVVRFTLLNPTDKATLVLRPLFSGRDYHALHHENDAFRFDPEMKTGQWKWRPYDGVPTIQVQSNGTYQHQPVWYRNFFYSCESERGLDCTEDLASPGLFRWELERQEAVWILTAGEKALPSSNAILHESEMRRSETARRAAFENPLTKAADAYIVKRGEGKTILAGYPWFTDWGRDTFIAIRGLCIATRQFESAEQILLDWSKTVSEGMLPNRFPDNGSEPEFNSVDASLWFIVAAHDFLKECKRCKHEVQASSKKLLQNTILAILEGYKRGTRYGIRMDEDGLIAAGVTGTQLTWMDAKVGDWVVTPRIGKPVEIQALWLNALWIASEFAEEWKSILDLGRKSFVEKFTNEETGGLYDVIDVYHEPGRIDASCRPNQIFVVGGLPLQLIDGEQARSIVDLVESKLWTPAGLRSLAENEPGYAQYYTGDQWHRDAAYHQGTVWTWLKGPFIESWIRVRGNTAEAKQEAQLKFVEPILARMNIAGMGHLSEIADAQPPHAPKGCPFQAWSIGELLRVIHCVLKVSVKEWVK
jgi:predicted glycogen debranching enzyme